MIHFLKNWFEAPRPRGGASRRGSFVHIVPLDPACKAGLEGHVSANGRHVGI